LTRPLIIAAVSALLALPALAHDHAAYSYADFEASVPHVDLDECPAGLAEGDLFRRITTNNDTLHIYVFKAGGDRHFASVHTCHEDEFELAFDR